MGYDGFIGATYSYVGTRTHATLRAPLRPTGQIEVGSYSTYDARLGLDNGRYRVTLYGKNLSDSRGITNYSAPPPVRSYSAVTVTQPLTVGLSLSAKF